jgi:hypothetical protein
VKLLEFQNIQKSNRQKTNLCFKYLKKNFSDYIWIQATSTDKKWLQTSLFQKYFLRRRVNGIIWFIELDFAKSKSRLSKILMLLLEQRGPTNNNESSNFT